ncbi:RNA-binding protein CP33, chloroplastic [Amborella trichopoda]|uniref:RRM domain-containing protein n=1 Tax=Amborella trichopoda TaxID=13333 RepID=W1NU17_AMBTC|nr:RNA-binding protein CP33, chloroplastic [Amborella trichopoda]ERN01107.1 hypothetical protein AMTR_s00002p00197820 [Amborella trichopoda]|eukprot:XP_006838538.1 RNA-binding protein CP33, chloroplastic [Amborella trichopoda]
MAAALIGSSSVRFLFRKCPHSTCLEPHNPPSLSLLNPCYPPLVSSYFHERSLHLRAAFAVEEVAEVKAEDVAEVEEEEEEEILIEKKRKLYAENLPWTFSANDLRNLFGQCGAVKDVDIIKHKNGKSRGFAFITMDSTEEAVAAIDKFDSYELMGRIIRVQFAKRMKPPRPDNMVMDTNYKIYATNLTWKVRSSHLREFFMATTSPVSARVVFDSPSGKSAGYGFIGYATKEEAEAAIAEFNGKELMGRPLRLQLSQRPPDEPDGESKVESDPEDQSEES